MLLKVLTHPQLRDEVRELLQTRFRIHVGLTDTEVGEEFAGQQLVELVDPRRHSDQFAC